jgi:hypothetical protein
VGKHRDKPVVGDLKADEAAVAGTIGTVIIQGSRDEPQPPTPRQKPPRNLPPKYDLFAGRETELTGIHERLSKQSSLGVTQQTAAHGHGGIGKTTVALEYAWRHLDDYPGGIFVLLCDRDLLFPAIADLADHLGIPEADAPEKTALLVKAHLESGEPSLLILDNVRDATQWRDPEWSQFLPAGNCRRLITTRASRLPGVDMYPIERLTRDDGIDLIAQFRPDAKDPANREIVGAIVEWFDGWAVALTVVGVYMSLHPDLSWSDYRESLNQKGLGTVRSTEARVHDEGGLPDRYEKRTDAIFDETLDALRPEQRRALEYAALLPEDTVLTVWLVWLLENDEDLELPEHPGYEKNPARPVIHELERLRLLRPVEQTAETFALHRVLRRRLVERLDQDDPVQVRLWVAIVLLAEHRGEESQKAVTDKSLRSELSPLLALAQALLATGRSLPAASLASRIYSPLHQLARFAETEALLLPFVVDTRCTIEKEDPSLGAALLSNLAALLWATNRFAAAERVHPISSGAIE